MANEFSINLGRLINELPEAINRRLDRACQIVENEAKTNCPVDDGVLRASITHQVEDNKGVIGSNVEYAPYVHEGTGLYAKDGQGRQAVPWTYKDAEGKYHSTKGQKPQPFLQDALDNNHEKILQCFEGVLEDGPR